MKQPLSPVLITRIVASVLILFGIYLMVANARNLSPEERNTDGLTPLTSIISKKTVREEVRSDDPEKKTQVFEITVEYKFGNTQKFYKTKMVDKGYYDRIFEGDSIVVYATPENPYHVVIPDSRDMPVSFWNGRFFIALVLLLAGVGLWWFSMRMKPHGI